MVKTALILLCLLSNISLNAGEQVLIYKNTEQADLKLHLLYPDDIKKSDKKAVQDMGSRLSCHLFCFWYSYWHRSGDHFRHNRKQLRK